MYYESFSCEIQIDELIPPWFEEEEEDVNNAV